MELKKTTILSAFVVVSGVLAEIIFRDTFSKSFAGVALSIALAAVVLVAFYFTVDGVYCLGSLHREQSTKRQKEYEQRVYNVLNEQLKFQKVVYSEVKNLQQQVLEQREKMSELSGNSGVAREELQNTPNLTREDLEQFAAEINHHTSRLTAELGSQAEKLASGLDGQTERLASEMGSQTEQIAVEVKEQLLEEMREETERLLSDMSGQAERLSAEMADQTDQAVSRINDHTMQAAKVVAKYVGKSTEEIKEEIRSR